MTQRIQDTSVLREQYKDSSHLAARISIHEKYSVNKQGFIPWIYANYQIEEGQKVLECGCGNGAMWKQFIDQLPKSSSLILSDFSEGMLEACKANVPNLPQIAYEVIDIQAIPYEADTFDHVIANMMLYHVPDLHRGLQEIARVLKPGGTFYCATYGENGMIEYISALFREHGADGADKQAQGQSSPQGNKVFTLQNGETTLRQHFGEVTCYRYEDHLEVTETLDLVDYVRSLTDMSRLGEVSDVQLFDTLEHLKRDGIIHVPKEYGMFVAKSPK